MTEPLQESANVLKKKTFGIEIDSLADIMNFVALPIAIFCGMGLTSLYNIIIYVVYALAAVTRLAYFNVNAKKNPVQKLLLSIIQDFR